MGARSVIATGRNAATLAALARRFGPRLVPVQMRGEEADDRQRLEQAASGPIDRVLDLLPPAAEPARVRAAAMAVRPGGTVVLMGGVGMLGDAGLELPYPWLMRNNITLRGQWMYPPDAAGRMVGLIRSGLVDLGQFEATCFALDRVNEAVAHAAADAGPFRMTVIQPGPGPM
jgi:alcohol dehydrogenase